MSFNFCKDMQISKYGTFTIVCFPVTVIIESCFHYIYFSSDKYPMNVPICHEGESTGALYHGRICPCSNYSCSHSVHNIIKCFNQ